MSGCLLMLMRCLLFVWSLWCHVLGVYIKIAHVTKEKMLFVSETFFCSLLRKRTPFRKNQSSFDVLSDGEINSAKHFTMKSGVDFTLMNSHLFCLLFHGLGFQWRCDTCACTLLRIIYPRELLPLLSNHSITACYRAINTSMELFARLGSHGMLGKNMCSF